MTRAEKLARLRAVLDGVKNTVDGVKTAVDGIYTLVEPWVPADPLPPPPPPPPTARRLSVPSYFYPGPKWDKLTALAGASGPAKGGLCIINPASGPGSGVSLSYATQVVRAQQTGLIVLGYVPAGYGNRSAVLVDGDIESYFSFYPTINGIFFDQAQDDGGTSDLPFFTARAAKVRAKSPGAKVVMNPGAATKEAYAAIADTLMVFEGPPAAYRTRVAPLWEATTPSGKFWHCVHSCPQAELAEMVTLAKTRNVGHLYITDDSAANPYDTLSTYVDELLLKMA